MASFSFDVTAANHAHAQIVSEGDVWASVKIDPEWTWSAEGLRKLAAALEGAARLIDAK